jgi:hypothetical protein
MIEIDKLAIDCGAVKYEAEVPQVYFMTESELTSFAKAYLNEWLKEQEVVAYERNGIYREDVPINDIFLYTRLIALPSEVK